MKKTQTLALFRIGFLTLFHLLALWLFLANQPTTQAAANVIFTVTKTSDSADGDCTRDCSLREAIAAANLVPGSDVIVPAGIYTLTISQNVTNDINTGDLNIVANMNIIGAGAETTVIVGHQSGWTDRIVRVEGAATNVSISGVTLKGGNLVGGGNNKGGGVYNLGSLKIINSIVRQNKVFGNGGGLYNDGPATLLLSNTIVISNATISSGLPEGRGAGIYNPDGALTLVNSQIIGNGASGYGGGVYSGSGINATLVISRSIIRNNNAHSGGGVIAGGIVQILNSVVYSNTAINSAGQRQLVRAR